LTEKSARKNAFLPFIVFEATLAVSVLSLYFDYFEASLSSEREIRKKTEESSIFDVL